MSKIRSIFVFICFLFSFNDINATDFKIEYVQQIFQDFNVNIPEIEAGYPFGTNITLIQYTDTGKAEIEAYIYLTNEAKKVWAYSSDLIVCPPTVDAAEEVLATIEDTVSTLKYVICSDTSTNSLEINDFLEVFGKEEPFMQINFMGSNGRFVPVKYWNENYNTSAVVGYSALTYNLEIMLNSEGQMLFERDFINQNDLPENLSSHLIHNLLVYDEALCCENPQRMDTTRIKQKIANMEKWVSEGEGTFFLISDSKVNSRLLELTQKFGQIPMKRWTDIFIKQIGRCSIENFYRQLSNSQKGIFMARNHYLKKRWNQTYADILARNDRDLIDVADLVVQDRIVVHYNDPPILPPPPPPTTE